MKKVRDGYKMTELGEIPNEWSIMKLSEIAEINPRKEVLDDKDTISFIAMEDITNNGRVINKTDKLYEEVKKGYTPFKDNDVLLAKITPCFENGKRALVGKLSNGIGFGSTEFHVLRANKESISKFLYYVISSHRFISKAENNMIGSAGQKRVPTEFIKDYVLAVPTIEEQEKIALIISTVDEQIDNVDALIEKNKELKKGLMQTLLTKGIGHTKFKNTEIGEIPEEWEVINAGRIFNIITDYVANGSFASLAENVKYKESEDFAIVVRLTDYKNEYKGPFVYVDKNAYDFLSKSKLEDNDIIIANVGAYAGYVFRAPNINKPITLGPNAILVRSEQNREFIYYLLSSEFGQKAIKDIISTTAQPKFNKTDFKKILLPIPDLKEQYKIA